MHNDLPVVRSSKNQLVQPADVLRLFKAGDPVVVRRFHRLAYALSRQHLTRNGCANELEQQEAEEVVQEVLLRLLVFQYDDRQVDAPVQTVMLSIVRRVWEETKRERKQMPLVELETAELAKLPDNWIVAVERQLLQEATIQAFRFDLKPRCHIVFDLRYFLDNTIANIAGALKLSIQGVDSRLLRCRRALKILVKKRLTRLYQEAESTGHYF